MRERQVVAMMIRADSVLAGKTKGRLLSNTVGWLALLLLLTIKRTFSDMAMHNNNNNRVSKHVWDIPGNGLIKSIIIIIN